MTSPPVIEGLFMLSLPQTSGVYILVFHLAKATSIAFDRKGTRHTFPPGWYLYVGSACGVGGLNSRLAQHQRRIASAAAVPRYLGKETIMQTLRSKAVKGKVIGKGRAALRLTVKNLWDFEEMMRRGLEPTAEQLQVTLSEIERIREIASQIERQ